MNEPAAIEPEGSGSEGHLGVAARDLVPRNAVALGLSALATTTFLSSLSLTGLLGSNSVWVTLGPAFAYGGLVQLLAGMWMLKDRNLLAGTTLSSFGGYWLSYASLEFWFMPRAPGADTGTAMAAFFLAWAVFSTYISIATIRHSRSVMVTFVLTTMMLFGLAGASYTGDALLLKIAGIVGILSAMAGWYAAAAMVIADSFRRIILPY